MKRSRCEELLGQLMRKVRLLEPGGDLEGLLEEGASQLKQALYEEAAVERQQVEDASPASFSPCGLPSVRSGGNDAPGGAAGTAGPDAGGPVAV